MKQTGRRWIGCLLGMLLAALLLGTTAFAGSADGALGSFVQDKLNELLEEELAPNVPDQAQGMMDNLTQEKEDGGLFSLLSMTPSELLAAIKDAALQQVSGPLEVLGRLLAVALLCAVLSAVRQSAVSARLQGIFLVVATACILSFLGEPVFACIDQTVQALRECSLFVMSFTPVMSGILIAGGNPASAGAYNLILFFAAQILAELAARTLIPLLNIYLALWHRRADGPAFAAGPGHSRHQIGGLLGAWHHHDPLCRDALAADGDRQRRGHAAAQSLQVSGRQHDSGDWRDHFGRFGRGKGLCPAAQGGGRLLRDSGCGADLSARAAAGGDVVSVAESLGVGQLHAGRGGGCKAARVDCAGLLHPAGADRRFALLILVSTALMLLLTAG